MQLSGRELACHDLGLGSICNASETFKDAFKSVTEYPAWQILFVFIFFNCEF